ncbi:hypothetical protein ABT142_09165 [Streptomyces sp. NPDC001857]|uniref:hypothetical protein n=1 Tax=unclassified Streptomyces TaxID=2593676 RepID=UPI00332395EB
MAERQQRRWGSAVVAGLMAGVCAAGLCAGAAGCSADGGDGEDDRAADRAARMSADPVRALRQAADALVAAGSSKARTSMEMATGGTRVTIRGEGVYDYRRRLGRLEVVLPQDPAGSSGRRPITELLTPGALFMKNRGAGVPADKWVRVDTATLHDGNLVTGGATDPYAAAEVLRGARDATYVGRTRLAGVEVRHYRGTADLAAAAAVASGEGRNALGAAAKGFATARVPFDVYLDEQGRIRKVRHRFGFANGRQAGARGASGAVVAVASTTWLYDFGVPVDVRLPAAGDIYAGRIAEE